LRHRERSEAIQTRVVVDDAEAQHGSAICAISAISNGSVWIATALRASQRRCGLMFAMFLHYTRVIDRVVMSSPASSRAAESRAAIQTGALMDDGQAKQESAITVIINM